MDRLCEILKNGDVVTVDLDAATVTLQATGKVYRFKPLGEVRPVVDAGGLLICRQTGMIFEMSHGGTSSARVLAGPHQLRVRLLLWPKAWYVLGK